MAAHITLKNGERVKVNDHVYCSPSWAVRDGTPYSVARIMEFLQPEGIPKGKGKGKENYTRVRLAWYYRPSDVSDRPVADSRLLLAAIYSEICDIRQLRSKCHVIHRDKITDLAGWKKRPDRFYFNRLFDPYIKKEFEVIQATDVRNLPANIRDILISRYEYVVAEKEVVPDLTDILRLCDTCSDWCPNPDTVRCDRCKKFFHMGCVQPPLLAKPSRGYGWTCAPCSRKHEEEVDSHEVRHPTPTITKPKSNAPAPRGRGRPRKDRTLADKEESVEIKHFKMWPFRYFGQYTVAEDTLDPDDLIFPRTATRVGPKFQASVPPAPGIESAGGSQDERGGDATIEVLSLVNEMSDDEVDKLEKRKESLAQSNEVHFNVDWLTEVIRLFTDAYVSGRSLESVHMRDQTRLQKWKKHETRWMDNGWTPEEIAAFEDAINLHGAELRAVREGVRTRPMPEVVRFYAHWKNSKLGEENVRIRLHGFAAKEDIEQSILDTAPLSDDEGSVVRQSSRSHSFCGACRARESKTWWKAPKGLPTEVLCDNCGTNWRKYADLNVRPLREESLHANKAKITEKREGTPLAGPNQKRLRSTPPPVTPSSQFRCLACHKNGPTGKVLKCKQCQIHVHAGSCGAVVDPASADGWTCELCQNEKTLEASLNPDCLLCPRRRKGRKKKAQSPPPDSFLRACKPTEGQGWCHVLCSVFIPEITYTDASRLRLVEGISTISHRRWSTKCTLCGESEGAVIRCSDCVKEYHASCAWNHGYRFGFEIQPVKSSKRDTTTITSFNGDTGLMMPVVCCKDHDTSKRDIYDICETNDMGETALQIYCRTYKQAQVSQAHGLLRKARRLDQILDLRGEGSVSSESIQSVPDPECLKCHTMFSPSFYRTSPSSDSVTVPDAWLCHRCHWEASKGGVASVSDVNVMVS